MRQVKDYEKFIVRLIEKKYMKVAFVLFGRLDELIQECRLVVDKCISKYTDVSEVVFKRILRKSIFNKVSDLIKRKKKEIANNDKVVLDWALPTTVKMQTVSLEYILERLNAIHYQVYGYTLDSAENLSIMNIMKTRKCLSLRELRDLVGCSDHTRLFRLFKRLKRIGRLAITGACRGY